MFFADDDDHLESNAVGRAQGGSAYRVEAGVGLGDANG